MSKDSDEIRSDEIDLIDLFRRIGRTLSRWFRGIGTAIIATFIFFIRNLIPLIISVFIGAGLSYAMKWTTKPVYRSQISLRSNTVPNAEMISYLNKLALFIREENTDAISTSLSLSAEKAARIRKIKACWVIDLNKDSIPDYVDYRNKYNIYDTVNVRMQDHFIVDVFTSDPGTFPEIRDGLLKYPKLNASFIHKNEFRLRKAEELLKRISYDIKQLDSLQRVKYFEETRNIKPEKGGQMVFLQEHMTQLVYNDIYLLYGKKQRLDSEKELYPDVLTVLSDFYQPVKRHNGGLYYGKVVIPVCFGLTLIILIIIRFRSNLKNMFERFK